MLSTITRTQLHRMRPYLLSSSTRLSSTTSNPSTEASSEGNSTGGSESKYEKQDELQMLYDAVLSKVLIHGWSEKAIEAAVVDLGWSVAAKRMISRGPVQVAEEFVGRCNRDLAHLLQMEDTQAMISKDNVVGRATYAIRERIKMNDPYHASWAKALALQALPQNSTKAIKNSAHMVDEIAHYAGYSAPDISWYMDRSVLGVTYHATELYWLTDNSPGKADTWRFLERKLQGSHALRSGVSSSLENVMTLADVASASVSSIFKSMRTSY